MFYAHQGPPGGDSGNNVFAAPASGPWFASDGMGAAGNDTSFGKDSASQMYSYDDEDYDNEPPLLEGIDWYCLQ